MIKIILKGGNVEDRELFGNIELSALKENGFNDVPVMEFEKGIIFIVPSFIKNEVCRWCVNIKIIDESEKWFTANCIFTNGIMKKGYISKQPRESFKRINHIDLKFGKGEASSYSSGFGCDLIFVKK